MEYAGTLNGAGNPNYPSATAAAKYLVTSPGKVGGINGASVNVGDLAVCLATNAGGSQAAVGTDWSITPATANTLLAAEVAVTSMPVLEVDQATVESLIQAATRTGIATVPGGLTTVNVATLAAKAGRPILVTPMVDTSTMPYVSNVVDDTSFMIHGDPGDYSWLISEKE